MYHPIYETGLFLAEQGHEHCLVSVAALRQYCLAYPQFWTQAEEIERLYNARLITGPSVPQASSADGSVSMGSTPESPAAIAGQRTKDVLPVSPIPSGRAPTSAAEANGKTGQVPPAGVDGEAGKSLSPAAEDWLH